MEKDKGRGKLFQELFFLGELTRYKRLCPYWPVGGGELKIDPPFSILDLKMENLGGVFYSRDDHENLYCKGEPYQCSG